MGACGSSDDTDDAKPTTDKPNTTTTKDKDKEETITVTFALNYKEATDTPPVAQTIKKGDKATKPADPTRDGYTFVDWYTDAATTKVFAFTTPITGDTKLYAGWTAIITYTVTFDGNYDGAAAPTTATVAKDDKATKPDDPTRDNYTFDDWYEKQDGTGTAFDFGTTPITADTILYAKWVKCPLRDARETLTHEVPLYNQGETDAPYLPKALRRASLVDEPVDDMFIFGVSHGVIIPAGKENELPYIRPDSHYKIRQASIRFLIGGFDITPDYIDASRRASPNAGDNTVRISCYSVKKVDDNLYFYYGKVRFLLGGQETEAFNKSMYAWTGINKNDPSNEDALYGLMVLIQGNYLRPLLIYPFVGGKYTRASDGKTVTFPKTEEQYAALTKDQLNIIATERPTSKKLFSITTFPADVKGIYGQ